MLHHTRATICMALLVSILALSVSGCGPERQLGGTGDAPGGRGPVRADDTALFAACVATCSENTSLALVTRTGCFDGCDQARRMVAFTGKEFSSRRECLDSLMQAEVRRQDSVTAMYRWCDAKWTHLHNRKGCYRATEAFFAALAPEPVCGSDVTESALYDIALSKAREEAKAEPAPAFAEPVLAPVPAPGPAPVPMVPPVSASTPTSLPVTDEPAVLPQGTTAPARQEASAPAGDSRVVRTTQPAGPIVPPPYVPEHAGTLPAIYDTPKYQPSPASKKSPARPEKTSPVPARVAVPTKQTPATKPAQERPAQARPAQERSGPVASGQVTPVPASPAQAGAAPVPAAPVTPAPVPRPSVSKTPPPQAGAATSAPERGAADARPAQAAPVPTSVSPASSVVPATPAPTENSASPQPAPENARRLDLPIPQQAPQQSSSPSVLMPPVPSMLNQPYAAPTIISPQVEPAPPGGR